MTSPVRSRTSASWPASRSSVAALGGAAVLPDERPVHRLAARRVPGDDGLALVGDPDRRRARAPSMPASAIASTATRRVTSQISAASCSTQPGRGKCCSNSE